MLADPAYGSQKDDERRAAMRGEGLSSRSRPPRRAIRGVSREADGLFTLLERAGGMRPLGELVGSGLGQFVSAAAAELEGLGLAERRGAGAHAVVVLTPAASGTILLPSWSMQ